MEERWAMKVHRALGRFSDATDRVPDWMWFSHIFLAAVAAIALTMKLDLPMWLGIVAFVLGTAALTLGLFHRVSAIFVAVLGTIVMVGASAVVIGGLVSWPLRHLLGETHLTIYLSCALGALFGLWAAIESYRPFFV